MSTAGIRSCSQHVVGLNVVPKVEGRVNRGGLNVVENHELNTFGPLFMYCVLAVYISSVSIINR